MFWKFGSTEIILRLYDSRPVQEQSRKEKKVTKELCTDISKARVYSLYNSG